MSDATSSPPDPNGDGPNQVIAFTRVRAPERPRSNLPLQLTSFIGREREMAEVKRLLAETRLLTLTGPGGCGTLLAVQGPGGDYRSLVDSEGAT